MQKCFSQYPTVYNRSGDNDDDDFPVMDGAGHIEPESNVDTVDQLEEDTEKSPDTQTTEQTDNTTKQ